MRANGIRDNDFVQRCVEIRDLSEAETKWTKKKLYG